MPSLLKTAEMNSSTSVFATPTSKLGGGATCAVVVVLKCVKCTLQTRVITRLRGTEHEVHYCACRRSLIRKSFARLSAWSDAIQTNPALRPQSLALTEKYGFMAAGEIEDFEIGPYCNTTMCTVPSGVVVETSHGIPVKVDISFDKGLITKIVVSFSGTGMRCCLFLTRSTEPIGPQSAMICRS